MSQSHIPTEDQQLGTAHLLSERYNSAPHQPHAWRTRLDGALGCPRLIALVVFSYVICSHASSIAQGDQGHAAPK